ncbi:KH domain-containing protein, partial [Oceanithermus sp.]
ILIGKGGRMLKELGRAARKQLELFLNRPVFLDLEVKVYPNWRKDPEALRELGYE